MKASQEKGPEPRARSDSRSWDFLASACRVVHVCASVCLGQTRKKLHCFYPVQERFSDASEV